MAERWTIKQLESMSDIDFIKAILQERLNKLSNCYSPLANRLKGAKHALDELPKFLHESMMGAMDDFDEMMKYSIDELGGDVEYIKDFSPEGSREDCAWDAGYFRGLQQVRELLSKVTL